MTVLPTLCVRTLQIQRMCDTITLFVEVVVTVPYLPFSVSPWNAIVHLLVAMTALEEVSVATPSFGPVFMFVMVSFAFEDRVDLYGISGLWSR